MKNLIGFTPYTATIAEMSAEGVSELVKLDPELARNVIDPKDDDPMFVTIEVLNEGVSRNGRKWTKELIASVAEQINSKKVDGYRGHLTENERSHKDPEAETIWLGATVKEVNGKVRLFAKGYVLPSAAHRRSYLRSAKAAGKNVAVSVYGTAKKVVKDASGVLSFGEFNLESVDWARSGSEGVQNMGVFSVTAEMTNDSNINPQENEMTREEVLRSATAAELREHNSSVVQEITQEARTAVEAEQATVVTEMTTITELVGENPAEKIAEMQATIRENELDSELRTKVQHPEARKFVRRLVVSEMNEDANKDKTVSEMVDAALATDEAKTAIKEMVETAPVINPQIDRPTGEARRFTKVVKRSK